MGIGFGIAATTAAALASKAQSAGSSAVAAANAAPQGISSGMDVVSATDETFSFVDNTEIVTEAPQYIETGESQEEPSEFEGFGSMFD